MPYGGSSSDHLEQAIAVAAGSDPDAPWIADISKRVARMRATVEG
jgi:hypothetical protein